MKVARGVYKNSLVSSTQNRFIFLFAQYFDNNLVKYSAVAYFSTSAPDDWLKY